MVNIGARGSDRAAEIDVHLSNHYNLLRSEYLERRKRGELNDSESLSPGLTAVVREAGSSYYPEQRMFRADRLREFAPIDPSHNSPVVNDLGGGWYEVTLPSGAYSDTGTSIVLDPEPVPWGDIVKASVLNEWSSFVPRDLVAAIYGHGGELWLNPDAEIWKILSENGFPLE